MTDSMPTFEDVALFPGFDPPDAPDEPEKLSADRRRTARQLANIRAGVHPLNGRRLHPGASRDAVATDAKNLPHRCGSCYFREVLKYHGKAYPKCMNPGEMGADDYEKFGPRYATHSASTDVRAWWPACPDYSPSDSISPDAARCIPDGDA